MLKILILTAVFVMFSAIDTIFLLHFVNKKRQQLKRFKPQLLEQESPEPYVSPADMKFLGELKNYLLNTFKQMVDFTVPNLYTGELWNQKTVAVDAVFRSGNTRRMQVCTAEVRRFAAKAEAEEKDSE